MEWQQWVLVAWIVLIRLPFGIKNGIEKTMADQLETDKERSILAMVIASIIVAAILVSLVVTI